MSVGFVADLDERPTARSAWDRVEAALQEEVPESGSVLRRLPRPDRMSLLSLGLSAASFLSWLIAVRTMDPADYTDLGLVSATNGWFWFALLLAVGGCVVAIRSRRFRWYCALAGVLAVIAVLYATPSVIEGGLRVEASFRHVGLADEIATTGQLHRDLDAYFNWPGMFAFLGLLQGSLGSAPLPDLARWAPPIAAVAYIPPVLLIARALGPQVRVQWLTVLTFLVANWTGQDYLSPQTMTFWLMLCIAGVVMTILRRNDDPDAEGPSAKILRLVQRRRRPEPVPAGQHRHRQRIGEEGLRVRLSRPQWVAVHVLVVAAIAACVATHQLTPFMLALVLFGLWLVGRSPHWWLWFGAGALILLWLAVPARPFVTGHLADITGGLLGTKQPGPDQTSNLGGRVGGGSAEHNVVVNARMAVTLVTWLLAGLGTLLLISARRRIRGVVLLAGLPFLMIPAQAYGGEMLIRAFLYGLPLVAYLIAVFLLWIGRGGGLARGVGMFLVVAALASTTVLTRYGNERGESFTPAEVGAFRWFFQNTPDGSTVEQLTPNTPHQWQRYASDVWLYQRDPSPGADWSEPITPSSILSDIERNGDDRPHAYVVYTRSQAAMAELMGNIEPGGLDPVVRALNRDPRFKVIYRNRDARIWEVVER